MKIAIINMTGGSMSAGYKKYLRNLLPRLSQHHAVEAILCAATQYLSLSTWFESIDKVTFVKCKPFRILGKRDADLYNELDKFNPDVIFIPTEKFFGYPNTPSVCMLQNMLPMVSITYPGVREKIRHIVQKTVARRAVNKARRVIAISDFVLNFLQQEWKVPPHKIGIVYHGVSVEQTGELIAPSTISPKWSGRFFFTAGSIELFRGLEDIIFAVRKLKQQGWDERVIIAGTARPAMTAYYNKLKSIINTLGVKENIYWAGMLNEKEMEWCYRNACAFIMSSRVEACPNTALEAMSCGSIIISSTAPPMEEFFGEAALYYEPGDEIKLLDCLNGVLNLSPGQKENMSKTALKRALNFTWENTVNKTVSEFQKAVRDFAQH